VTYQDTDQSTSENIDAELTGIIYEAALDPHLWPDLLEALVFILTQQNSERSDTAIESKNLTGISHKPKNNPKKESDEEAHFSRLLPHFHRALAINRRYNSVHHEHHLSSSIINQLPIGIVVLDSDRNVISSNRRAEDIASRKLGVTIKNSVFIVTDKTKAASLDRYLKMLLGKESDPSLTETYSLTVNREDQAALSLLISADTYFHAHYDSSAKRKATVFIASPLSRHPIDPATLQLLFQLSPAEARLTASLASGITVDDAATQNGITKHTARTQLKNIFQKTSVHKQTELIKLVLTSPAVLGDPASKQHAPSAGTDRSCEFCLNEETLTLPDGRKLCFCEYGDPKGVPVIFFHGILGSRYERHPNDSVIKALGIRLIVPDRPGYGSSDANPEGGYLAYVADVLRLVDYLRVARFAVMGLSVGAVYAAACAYKLPTRISSATLVGMTLPFRSFSDIADLLPAYKMHFAFARYLPRVAKLFPETTIKNACLNPGKFFKNMPLNQSDREIFFRDELHAHVVQSLLTGSRNSFSGFVDDVTLSVKPCSFPISEITVKVDFWHGADDLHSPIRRVQKVADSVESANFFAIQSAGHFFIYDYWEEILKRIVAHGHST